MNVKEGIKLKGIFEAYVNDNGEWKLAYRKENRILDDGLELVLARLVNDDATTPKLGWIAIGDDFAPIVDSQDTLGNEVIRKAFTSTSVSATEVVMESTFDYNEANFNWREVGMFNESTGGTIFNRVLINFTKNTSMFVKVVFRVQIQRG